MNKQQEYPILSVFGLVLNNEGKILFVRDKPRNDTMSSNPKIKLPGGNVPPDEKDVEEYLRWKVDDETGIRTQFQGGEDKIPGKRVYINKTLNHSFEVILLKAIEPCNINLGKKISWAKFLSISEVHQILSRGDVLYNHSAALGSYFAELLSVK